MWACLCDLPKTEKASVSVGVAPDTSQPRTLDGGGSGLRAREGATRGAFTRPH